MRIDGLREIVALEMWCVSRSDRPRALAEWPTMLDIDKADYYKLADAAIAAVAPLIAAEARDVARADRMAAAKRYEATVIAEPPADE